MVDKSQQFSTSQLPPPTTSAATLSKIWASQNQYFSVPHSQANEKNHFEVPTHFILANEPRLKDQLIQQPPTTSKSQEKYYPTSSSQLHPGLGKPPTSGANTIFMPQLALQHSNTHGSLEPQFSMQGTSILRQKSGGAINIGGAVGGKKMILKPLVSAEESSGGGRQAYADEAAANQAEQQSQKDIRGGLTNNCETDDSRGKFDFTTDNTHMSIKSKGFYSLAPKESRNHQVTLSKSLKDRQTNQLRKNVPISMANMRNKVFQNNHNAFAMSSGSSIGMNNKDLNPIVGFRKDIVTTPSKINRPRTFAQQKRQTTQNVFQNPNRNIYQNGNEQIQSTVSPGQQIQITSELRKSSQEQYASVFGGRSVQSIYADSQQAQSKKRLLSQVEEQQSQSMDRTARDHLDQMGPQQLVVNINTTNYNTTNNYLGFNSNGATINQKLQQMTPSNRTIPVVKDKRPSIDQLQIINKNQDASQQLIRDDIYYGQAEEKNQLRSIQSIHEPGNKSNTFQSVSLDYKDSQNIHQITDSNYNEIIKNKHLLPYSATIAAKTSSIGGRFMGKTNKPGIMTYYDTSSGGNPYNISAEKASMQQSIDDLYKNIEYIYKNKSRLNKQLYQQKFNQKEKDHGGSLQREGRASALAYRKQQEDNKNKSGFGFYNASELTYADKNYRNYIKANSRSQKQALKLMNPLKDTNYCSNVSTFNNQKKLRKFIDFEKEAEIDTLLSKIRQESKQQNNGRVMGQTQRIFHNSHSPTNKLYDPAASALSSSPERLQAANPIRDAGSSQLSIEMNQIEDVFDNLSNTIQHLECFDENLKLKLHLNLELNQQDFKIWKKHISMMEEEDQDYHLGLMGDRMGSRHGSKHRCGQHNYDYLISVMRNITQNLIDPSNTLYNPQKYNPQTHSEQLQELINQDLRTVNDCIRSLMQQNSITWLMLHQTKMQPQQQVQHYQSDGDNGTGVPEQQQVSYTSRNNTLIDDQQLYSNLKTNQVLAMSVLFLSVLINNIMQQQNFYKEHNRITLENQVIKIKEEISQTLIDERKAHAEKIKKMQQEMADMNLQFQTQKKEKDRLTEVVREMENDIKILLEGGKNFFQIRDLMAQLHKDLNQLDESANRSTRTSQIVRGVLQQMENIELESIKIKSQRKKKKQMVQVEENLSTPNEPEDLEDNEIIKMAPKKKKGAKSPFLDKSGFSKTPVGAKEITDEQSDLSFDDNLLNIFEPDNYAQVIAEDNQQTDTKFQRLDIPVKDPQKVDSTKERQSARSRGQAAASQNRSNNQKQNFNSKKEEPMDLDQRKKFLLEQAQQFMNPRELELFKARILEPKIKKKDKPETVTSQVQTKLCMSREPFQTAIWRMDNPQLAEKRDKEKYEGAGISRTQQNQHSSVMGHGPGPVGSHGGESIGGGGSSNLQAQRAGASGSYLQGDNGTIGSRRNTGGSKGGIGGITKNNRSAVSSKIEEDDSSDQSTKKDIKNFKQMISKMNVKQIMRPLPDHAIFRLIDVSILEMVQFDMAFYTKGVFAGTSYKNPPKEQLNYSDHLQKFLMTQYGLPVMAVGYFDQIQKRILYLSQQDPPQKTSLFMSKLLNLKSEAPESSIEIVESNPLDKLINADHWIPMTQRVAIFAKLIFDDAQENGQLKQYCKFAPRTGLALSIVDQIGGAGGHGNSNRGKVGFDYNKKQMQPINMPRTDNYSQQRDDEVSMFELSENMGKYFPASRITLRMIEYLKPAQFDQFPEDSLDLELEMINLKFAKMKITAKLAMMNFDFKAFSEKLDEKGANTILLYKLFSRLAENLAIYFSVNEQIAIRNALFPNTMEENVSDSRTREVTLGFEKAGMIPSNNANQYKDAKKSPSKDKKKKNDSKTFYEVLVFSTAEFQVNIKEYMVSKWDFIEFVMVQWQEHMNNLSHHVEESFKQYDSLHNRNALNFEQFLRLITFDLRLQFKQCFGINESIKSLEEFYQNILIYYEKNETLRMQGLVGLETVKHVVMQKNNDNLPFFKFIQIKYQNLSQSQKKNMLNMSKHQLNQQGQLSNNAQKMLKQMHQHIKTIKESGYLSANR